MTKKSMVQVVIGGKVLTMGGYDDETHIQRIASCVNRVMRQMEDADEYRCLPADLKPIFIHINIADELVTAQELIDQMEQELQEKEKELAELKQELAETEVRLEKLEGHKKRVHVDEQPEHYKMQYRYCHQRTHKRYFAFGFFSVLAHFHYAFHLASFSIARGLSGKLPRAL